MLFKNKESFQINIILWYSVLYLPQMSVTVSIMVLASLEGREINYSCNPLATLMLIIIHFHLVIAYSSVHFTESV